MGSWDSRYAMQNSNTPGVFPSWPQYPPQPVQTRLTDEDVERIARRVAELLREG